MSKKYEFNTQNQSRLDKFLVSQFPLLSRSRLQTLIKEGQVLVDGKIISKSGYVLEGDMAVSIVIPDTVSTDLIPEDIPLNIIFENEDLLIINKEPGMVVHPAAGHDRGTLVHAALAHAPEMEGISGEHRPGVIHRLDKDTSGIIIMAKNDFALRFVQKQFKERTINKKYIAITDGFPPTPNGRVEAPIGRDPSHRKKMAIVPSQRGREAITIYKVKERFAKHSLVEAFPKTGRTHQIRLHMAFLECPIVGDKIYGLKKNTIPVSRQMLHAAQIEFILPGELTNRTFDAPLPEDMQRVLQELRNFYPGALR
jgi:23S rRNA pseudouridine1911/1915/1917 synthase